jgi:hypothetical protein
MQILRRPETAQGRFGFWESGSSNCDGTVDHQVNEAARKMRGERYFAALRDLVDLFDDARSEDGGEQVDVRAFARTRDLLDRLPHGFDVPEVGMDPDGEIALDWIRHDRTMLSLSIGALGDLSYAAHLRDRTAHGVIKLGNGFPGALTELLRTLYHPA